MALQYTRPPITEAVVEFRLQTPMDQKLVSRLNQSFAGFYPREGVLQEIEIVVGPPGTRPPTAKSTRGFKRMTLDAAEIVLVRDVNFGVAQLAPYPGWEVFYERVKRDWATWRNKTGYRDLARIGVRFINRIDIPFADEGATVTPSDYVNALPSLPKSFEEIHAYQMTALTRLEALSAEVRFNTGIIESPLLKHMSILLDIDIGINADIPKKEDEIFAFLSSVRAAKNQLFEESVTDKARELFQ